MASSARTSKWFLDPQKDKVEEFIQLRKAAALDIIIFLGKHIKRLKEEIELNKVEPQVEFNPAMRMTLLKELTNRLMEVGASLSEGHNPIEEKLICNGYAAILIDIGKKFSFPVGAPITAQIESKEEPRIPRGVGSLQDLSMQGDIDHIFGTYKEILVIKPASYIQSLEVFQSLLKIAPTEYKEFLSPV